MNIAIFGALGRLGQQVVQLAKNNHNLQLIDVDFCQNPLDKVDVVIDFSLADGTRDVVDFCLHHNCPLVTGVTGRDNHQQNLIDNLATRVTVIQKSNFCLGIELLEKICNFVASQTDWKCEIIEIHHRNKKDMPSGTAKMLAGGIAKRRTMGKVTTHSLRLGNNLGTHQVIFATQGQSLTLTHQADDLKIFAQGALDCATSIVKKQDFD